MKTATFSGVVLPQHSTLSLDAPIVLTLQDRAGQTQMRVSYSIILNQIVGRLDDINPSLDLLKVRNMLHQLVQIMVYSIGFLKGLAYDFEILSIQDLDTNDRIVYGIGIPDLEKRNQSRGIADFSKLLNLCSGIDGVFLRRTIADCVAAMKNPDDTGFHCYRALETLKQWFAQEFKIEADRDQWDKMKLELVLGDVDVALLKTFAFPARHGIPLQIDDATRSKIFITTWDIVDRYIKYRNGDAP